MEPLRLPPDAGLVRLEARPRGPLEVALPENPSTGFRWAALEQDPDLQLEWGPFEAADASVGGGGWRRLRAGGTGRALLEERRAWEGSATALHRLELFIEP